VIRVVIDTNVLVSGLQNRKGNEARVTYGVERRMLRPCLSEAIFLEYIDVLARPKFGFPIDDVARLLSTFRRLGAFFETDATLPAVPDQSDAMFMACAAAANAEYLVTGNRRHFPDPFYGSARVVNARELLNRVAPDA
jgi:putative PIN family toxin of toxin-antitoxin system